MHHSSWLFPGTCSSNIHSQTSDAAFQDGSTNVNVNVDNKKQMLTSLDVNSFVRSVNRNGGIQMPGGGGFLFRAANLKERKEKWRSVENECEDGNVGKSLNDFLSILNDSVDRVAVVNESTERTSTSSFGMSFRSSKEHDATAWSDLINLVSTTAHEFRCINDNERTKDSRTKLAPVASTNDATRRLELVEIYSEMRGNSDKDNEKGSFRAIRPLEASPTPLKDIIVKQQDEILRTESFEKDPWPIGLAVTSRNKNVPRHSIRSDKPAMAAAVPSDPIDPTDQPTRFGSRSWPIFSSNRADVDDFVESTDVEGNNETACSYGSNENDEGSLSRLTRQQPGVMKRRAKVDKRSNQENFRKNDAEEAEEEEEEEAGREESSEPSEPSCDREETHVARKKEARPYIDVGSKRQEQRRAAVANPRDTDTLVSAKPSRIAILEKVRKTGTGAGSLCGKRVGPGSTKGNSGISKQQRLLDTESHQQPASLVANKMSLPKYRRGQVSGMARCATRPPTPGVVSNNAEHSLKSSSSVIMEARRKGDEGWGGGRKSSGVSRTYLEGSGTVKYKVAEKLPAKTTIAAATPLLSWRSKTFVDRSRRRDDESNGSLAAMRPNEVTASPRPNIPDEKSEFQEKHARSLRMLKSILSHRVAAGFNAESGGGLKRDARQIRSRISLESAIRSQLPVSIGRSSRNKNSSPDSPRSSKTLFEKVAIFTEPRDPVRKLGLGNCFASSCCARSTKATEPATVDDAGKCSIAKSFRVAESQTLSFTVADKDSSTIERRAATAAAAATSTCAISTRDAWTDCRRAPVSAAAASSRNVASGKDSEIIFISRECNTESAAGGIFVKSRGVCFRGARKLNASCQVSRPMKYSKDAACGEYEEVASRQLPITKLIVDTVDRSVDSFGPETVENACQVDTRRMVEVAIGDEPCHQSDQTPSLGPPTVEILRDVAPSCVKLELQRFSSEEYRCFSGSSFLVWQGAAVAPVLNDASTSSSLDRLQPPPPPPPEHDARSSRGRAIAAAVPHPLRILVEGASLFDCRVKMFRMNNWSKACGASEQLESRRRALSLECRSTPPPPTLLEIETKESQIAVKHAPISAARYEMITIVIQDLLENVVRNVEAKREAKILDAAFEIIHGNSIAEKEKYTAAAKHQSSRQFFILSRNSLLTVVYGTVCSFVFWALQFSITCDSL